jgi:hypothetical protein
MLKVFKTLQQFIDSGTSATILIHEIEQSDREKHPLEHIIVLHWIAESLLREVLQNRDSMGVNVHAYHDTFPNSILKIKSIKTAIRIRNNTAHNGLIRDPERTSFVIDTYLKYIKVVAEERGVKLDEFIPPPRRKVELLEDKVVQKSRRIEYGVAFLLLLLAVLLYYFYQPKELVFFFTGESSGTYFSIGEDIKEKIEPKIEVVVSEGSMMNIRRIGLSKKEDSTLAFVQNDVLEELSQKAFAGVSEARRILENTKVILPIYSGEI